MEPYWINKQPDDSMGGGGGEFSGEMQLSLIAVQRPVIFKVTVGAKTDAHRFRQASLGSLWSFFIDDIEAPAMILTPGD